MTAPNTAVDQILMKLVQSAGSLVTTRTSLNFGAGFALTDNPGNDSTDVSAVSGPNGLNPKATFGAKMDGVTDDTNAFGSLVTQLSAQGGGDVYLPLGTMLIKPTANGQQLFTFPPNVRIFGASRTGTVIRVAGGGTVNYTSLFTVGSGFGMFNLTIDQNPNASGSGPTPNGSMYAIYAPGVTGFDIDHVTIKHCGANAVFVGGASSQVSIVLNRFEFHPSGTTWYDVSSVYVHASDYAVSANVLAAGAIPTNPLLPYASGGIELHLGPGTALGNIIENYQVGINVLPGDFLGDAPGYNGHYVVGGNTINGGNIGIQFYAYTQAGNSWNLLDVTVANNPINIDQNAWGAAMARGVIPAGTASLSNGSTVVTGSGTSWNTALQNGQFIQFSTQPGTNYAINGAPGATSMAITPAYSGAGSPTGVQIYAGGIASIGLNMVISDAGLTTPASLYDTFNIIGNTISFKESMTYNTPGGAVYLSCGINLDGLGTWKNVQIKGNRISYTPGCGIFIGAVAGTSQCKNLTVTGNTFHNIGIDASYGNGVYQAAIYLTRSLDVALFDKNEFTYDATYPSSSPYVIYANPAAAHNVAFGDMVVLSSAPGGAAVPLTLYANIAGLYVKGGVIPVSASTYTVDAANPFEQTILTDSTANTISITLAPAAGAKPITIADKTGQAATNPVTLHRTGGDVINNATSLPMNLARASVRLQPDGVNTYTITSFYNGSAL